jgi:hypothetical protein
VGVVARGYLGRGVKNQTLKSDDGTSRDKRGLGSPGQVLKFADVGKDGGATTKCWPTCGNVRRGTAPWPPRFFDTRKRELELPIPGFPLTVRPLRRFLLCGEIQRDVETVALQIFALTSAIMSLCHYDTDVCSNGLRWSPCTGCNPAQHARCGGQSAQQSQLECLDVRFSHKLSRCPRVALPPQQVCIS